MKKLMIVFIVLFTLSACISHSQKAAPIINTVSFANNTKAGINKKTTHCPSIGVIRWDAWFGDRDSVGQAVIKSLSAEKWHYRLPFCAEVDAFGSVKINCASQAVMDQEITYAKRAGIDYWAFVLYEPDSPLSLGLQNYLSSTKKSSLNFSLITGFGSLWQPTTYQSNIIRIINLMRNPSYQKVANGRPLFYMGFFSDQWLNKWHDTDEIRKTFIEFRQQAKNAGLANPYIVVMDFNPKRAQQLADQYGFDAISTYAIPGNGGQAPHQYEMLASNAEQYWQQAKTTGAQIVPTVMSGWDRRPRVENPVPWEKGKGDISQYYESPTPTELGQHLKNALGWVKSELNQTEANTLIIYAWNEFDEGGWLAPTLSEGTARIDALGAAVRQECPAKH